MERGRAWPASAGQLEPGALVVGTYSERLPHVDGRAEGVLGCSLKGDTVGPPRVLARARNPSFIVLNGDGRRLYAVNESPDFEGEPGGGVTAFCRDPSTGELSELNTVPSGGREPAHLGIDPSGRYLVVANYGSGSVTVFELATDGRIGAVTGRAEHQGQGPHPLRQGAPHAHMVVFDPCSGQLLVPDLGLDAVLVYALSACGGLAEVPGRRLVAVPGAGPRHLAFHPDGDWLFVVNELDNTVVLLRRVEGGFVTTGTAPTAPGHLRSRNQAAAVKVAPSGRWVLVSNRRPDEGEIAVLGFDAASGSLELVGRHPSSGLGPRDLLVTRSGKRVVVANQDSSSIVVLAFDDLRGRLTTLTRTAVPTPACLVPVYK